MPCRAGCGAVPEAHKRDGPLWVCPPCQKIRQKLRYHVVQQEYGWWYEGLDHATKTRLLVLFRNKVLEGAHLRTDLRQLLEHDDARLAAVRLHGPAGAGLADGHAAARPSRHRRAICHSDPFADHPFADEDDDGALSSASSLSCAAKCAMAPGPPPPPPQPSPQPVENDPKYELAEVHVTKVFKLRARPGPY